MPRAVDAPEVRKRHRPVTDTFSPPVHQQQLAAQQPCAVRAFVAGGKEIPDGAVNCKGREKRRGGGGADNSRLQEAAHRCSGNV